MVQLLVQVVKTMARCYQVQVLPALRRFAIGLGWKDLELRQFGFVDKKTDTAVITTHYESRDRSAELLIREFPRGQYLVYQVAVYAIRYRLFSGWHDTRLTRRIECDQHEVRRLAPWVHRRHFSTARGRERYRLLHPECRGFTWDRIREVS